MVVWTQLHIEENKSKKVALFGVFLAFVLVMGLVER